MSCLKAFRLKVQKIVGILFVLFSISFGLQSSQDLLARSTTSGNAALNHSHLNKKHQKDKHKVSKINFYEDDQDTIHHHNDLKSPQISIFLYFLTSFKDFPSEISIDFARLNLSKNVPVKGLYLNNRALLI